MSGKFKPGLLVQDNTWDGPLCVVQYMAKGGLEMVAECVGRDVDDQRIVRFLVVSNFRIYIPLLSMTPFLSPVLSFLSPSILMTWLSLLLTPPLVGPPPSNPLAMFANTIFDYMFR